jgi:hypothetical protein
MRKKEAVKVRTRTLAATTEMAVKLLDIVFHFYAMQGRAVPAGEVKKMIYHMLCASQAIELPRAKEEMKRTSKRVWSRHHWV